MNDQGRARRVIVVGCGVSGLTTGVYLAERGHQVEIWTREKPENTTSAVAGGIWHPFQVNDDSRVHEWSRRTLEELCRLAAQPNTGVCLRQGVEVYRTPQKAPPRWHSFLKVEKLAASRLPKGCVDGYRFEVPVVETPVYLGKYLMGRFLSAGGKVKVRNVQRLDEALSQSDWVVNCSGLGARELAGDESIYPIRGEVLRLSPSPTNEFVLDHEHPGGHTYILPRLGDCVLGGTCDEQVWSLEPSPAKAQAIRQRCAEWVSDVKSATAQAHLVGLRPARPTVRLEREGDNLIHNYGHGGAGYTLSWGCAEEVELLLAWEQPRKSASLSAR